MVLRAISTPEHPLGVWEITDRINNSYEQHFWPSAISRSIRRELREGQPIVEASEGKYYWAGENNGATHT